MKAFKQLCVGDKLYRAVIELGKSEDHVITEITVKDIGRSEKGNLKINMKYDSYYREETYDFLIHFNEADVDTISGVIDFPGFWFTDIDKANEYIRQLVVARIESHYAAIKKAERDHLYTIEQFRIRFHELLNPTHHQNFIIK